MEWRLEKRIGDTDWVWPDLGVKSSPTFAKVAKKIAKRVITKKVALFKMVPKFGLNM